MTFATVFEQEEEYFTCGDLSSSEDEGDIGNTTTDLDQVAAEDSDVDDDIRHAHGAKTTSEKRRTQNAVMRAFAADLNAQITQQEINEVAAKSAKEEQLSIRDILANQAINVRITNPRDYQTELFQRAKTQNTIAVLDTGTGKTHIATLLLRHVLAEELEHRAKGGTHRLAFFLVRHTCY